ncbi:MAG: protein-glutamate O-methyltransferase CheR [Pirellulaceae bacterium]|nr:protein-glutamate O-methyltransferase CheR [Pirellulaceae bacterium]
MHVTKEEFDRIRELINTYCGLSLATDKLYLAQSRLLPLLSRYNLGSFGDLIECVQSNQPNRLRDEFIESMVTNETSFNRDTHPFEALRTKVLPMIAANKLERKQRQGIPFTKVRVWSVAASTGQEPYSIAMAIADFVAMRTETKLGCEQFWILASDISERALNAARQGMYSDLEMNRGVTPDQKAKYFVCRGAKWEVAAQLKGMLEFRKLNILTNVSDLVGFDLVFCRNLLYYFDEPARIAVCDKMINSLNQGGILIIGSAEHLPPGWESRLQQMHVGRTMLYIKR